MRSVTKRDTALTRRQFRFTFVLKQLTQNDLDWLRIARCDLMPYLSQSRARILLYRANPATAVFPSTYN